MLDEVWCPIYTPFWKNEAADFVDLHSVEVLDRLGLFVHGADVDDPSVRASRLSFWTVFELRAHDEMGTEEFKRMVEDDTLALWEDHMEACLAKHFRGKLSVSAVLSVMRTCGPQPSLIPPGDWKKLCQAFLSSAIWAASILRHHRQICESAPQTADPKTGYVFCHASRRSCPLPDPMPVAGGRGAMISTNSTRTPTRSS